MKTITHHELSQNNTGYSTHPGYAISETWNKLIRYSESQEENRFLWAAISLLGHATFFTIGTLIIVFVTGNDFLLLTATCLTMAMVLVVNLAALPTKYIIPFFFFSLLADVLIIITAVILWFN